MALVKTVEMRILASAGDAQKQLDEVAGKADRLEASAIRMRFRLDDKEGQAQLDEIRAKADRLGFRDVSVRVKVDGAGRAIAELAAVRHEEEKVSGGGLLSRIGGLLGAPGGAIPGQVGLPFAGGLPLPALAAAVPLIGALATELTAVASGFAAAGAGAGAFALLAAPAVKQVETAYQNLSKAQAAYDKAVQKEKLDPSKANQGAVKTAQDNLMLAGIAFAKLPASEREAVGGIQQLTAEFGKMSRAFAPQAFKVFADGLKLISGLLPQVTPFASTFASSLDKLLQQAGKFTQSKGFTDWLRQFHSLEGPAIGAIGHGIGQVAVAAGKLLTIFSGKDVAHAINIGFGAIAGTINVIASGINRFRENWDSMSKTASRDAHQVAASFDVIRHGIASLGHDIAHIFDNVRHGIADSFGHQIARDFDQVRHAVASAGHDIASVFDGMRHGVAAGWGRVASFFSSIPGKIRGFFAGAAGWLIGAGGSVIAGLGKGATSAWGAVTAFLGSIPGRIRGFFAGAAGWLVQAGANIIRGLINGIESMAGAVAGAIGGIVSKIRSFLPFSPAKQGPLSGSGSPDIAGRKIALMLASGMDSGAGAVQRSAGRLAGAAGVAPAAAGAGYGGGMELHVHFHGITPADKHATAQQIHQVLRDFKRNRGGAALGLG